MADEPEAAEETEPHGGRLELPGGAWVDLKDPFAITEDERKPLRVGRVKLGRQMRPQRAPGAEAVASPHPILGGGQVPVEPVPTDEEISDQIDAIDAFERQVNLFFIEDWSFDYEPTLESLVKLPAHIYGLIDRATVPLFDVLFPPDRGPYNALTDIIEVRQGNDVEIPEWASEAIRLHDLVELTHWTLAEISATPAITLDRLLLIRQADIEAQKEALKRR